MADIKPFPGVTLTDRPADSQPNPDVVETLERLYNLAKTGELQAITYVWVNDLGDPIQGCRGSERWTYQIGYSISSLFHWWFQRENEQVEEVEQ